MTGYIVEQIMAEVRRALKNEQAKKPPPSKKSNDPLGLGRPAKDSKSLEWATVFGSKIPVKSDGRAPYDPLGLAVRSLTTLEPPKPKQTLQQKREAERRVLDRLTGADLKRPNRLGFPGVPAAPIHQLLRDTPGTLEAEMAYVDALLDPDPETRALFRSTLELFRGRTTPGKIQRSATVGLIRQYRKGGRKAVEQIANEVRSGAWGPGVGHPVRDQLDTLGRALMAVREGVSRGVQYPIAATTEVLGQTVGAIPLIAAAARGDLSPDEARREIVANRGWFLNDQEKMAQQRAWTDMASYTLPVIGHIKYLTDIAGVGGESLVNAAEGRSAAEPVAKFLFDFVEPFKALPAAVDPNSDMTAEQRAQAVIMSLMSGAGAGVGLARAKVNLPQTKGKAAKAASLAGSIATAMLPGADYGKIPAAIQRMRSTGESLPQAYRALMQMEQSGTVWPTPAGRQEPPAPTDKRQSSGTLVPKGYQEYDPVQQTPAPTEAAHAQQPPRPADQPPASAAKFIPKEDPNYDPGQTPNLVSMARPQEPPRPAEQATAQTEAARPQEPPRPAEQATAQTEAVRPQEPPRSADRPPAQTEAVRPQEPPRPAEQPPAQTEAALAQQTPTLASPVQRIEVFPERGDGKVETFDEMISDLAKDLGVNVRPTKQQARRTHGFYRMSDALIAVSNANDVSTAAHEVAHYLDDLYGVTNRQIPENALRQMTEYFSHTVPKDATPEVATAERFAELVHGMVLDPARVRQIAPDAVAFYESVVPAGARQAIDRFGARVRNWASLDPTQRVGGNVQLQRTQAGVVKKIKDKILAAFQDVSEIASRRKSNLPRAFRYGVLDRIAELTQDRTRPIVVAIDYVSRVDRALGESGPLPENDPLRLMRLWSGSSGKALDMLENGLAMPRFEIDGNGNIKRETGGGMDWLLEPFGYQKDAARAEQLRELAVNYMVAERTIELARLAIRNKLLDLPGVRDPDNVSGIGGGMRSDYEEALAAVEAFQKHPDFPAIQEASRRYRMWMDGLLRYMVDSGRMSKSEYDTIKAKNEHYAAFKRIFDEWDEPSRPSAGKFLGSPSETVQEIKGSTRTIKDPYIDLVESTLAIVTEADRNRVMQAFTDILARNRGLHDGPPIRFADIGYRASARDHNTVRVFRNGKVEHWVFEPNVLRALRGLGEITLPDGAFRQMEAAFRFLPLLMRNSVVYSPPFVVRNVFRDAVLGNVQSRTGRRPTDNFGQKAADVQAWRLAGGDHAGHYRSTEDGYNVVLAEAISKARKDRRTILTTPAVLLDWWKGVSESSERVGRIAEYRAAYRHAKDKLGYDDYNAMLYAASEARDVIDYAVAGSIGRWVNRYVPFTNAAIQGVARTYRGVKENPRQFAARWAVYTVVPSVLVYAYNQLNGDIEEWRAQPTYLRDYFWSVKVGPDLWVRIPKPFEIGAAASGIERLIDAGARLAEGDSKTASDAMRRAFEGYGRNLVRVLSPAQMSDLFAGPFQAAVEVGLNRDLFRNRDIVPYWENNLNLDLRNTSDSPRLAQALQRMIGADARKIEQYIRSTTTWYGDTAMRLSDLGRYDRPRSLGSDVNWAVGITVAGPGSNSPDVDWVNKKARGAGIQSSPLKEAMDAVRLAKTEQQRAAAKLQLRMMAKELRRALEAAIASDPKNETAITKEVLSPPKRRTDPWRTPAPSGGNGQSRRPVRWRVPARSGSSGQARPLSL